MSAANRATALERTNWHQLDDEQVLEKLKTSHRGLSRAEAARRLEQYGPNELSRDKGSLPLAILLRQIKSPLIYILMVAGIVTFVLGKYIDTAVIGAVIVLNSVVGFIQEYRAEQSLRSLAKLAAPKARVIRDGEELEIDAREVVPGDVVLLTSGAKVPADLRLFRAVELRVDESILTGESVPTTKKAEANPDPVAPLGDQAGMAFTGTIVVRGRGAGIAVATGAQTAFGRIFSSVGEVGEVMSPLQVRLDKFAKLIAVLTIGLSAIIVAMGVSFGEALTDILVTAVAVAVATVPEGLPVAVTIALAVGVRRMAQRQAIIRRLPVVETLGSCTRICSDKTGTLTKNEMTVTKIVAGGHIYDVTGVGYAPEGKILLGDSPVSLAEYPTLEMALRIGMLCTESSVYKEDGRYRADGDPTEAALIVAAMKGGLHEDVEQDRYPLLAQIPFESERRYMATLHRHNESNRLVFVKGAPERILEMCQSGDGDPDAETVLQQSKELAAEGLRVLALAYREAPEVGDTLDHHDVEAGLHFIGLQAMIDPPRPEAIEAVEGCKRSGIQVAMVTGDHRVTAEAIAWQMGIASEGHSEVIDGRQLEMMSDDELFERVRDVAVFARAAPEHKLRIVQQLRRHNEVVAVTGDGVNDAPALKQADIGVAMGRTGTDVAKESAAMVLVDDNFATIYAAVEEGRVVFENIRKLIMFLIPTGLGLVLTVMASLALRIPLPFLPAQAIWINLVTNGLQDVSMGFEPGEKGLLEQRPRDPKEGILNRLMVERTILVGLVLLCGTLGVFIWQLQIGETLEHARTMAMTTMVLFQNFHIFNSRSFTKSVFQINPFSNRILFGAILGALGLHILALYWGPLQFILRTVPLTFFDWLVLVPVAASVLVVVEIDKAIRRAAAPKPALVPGRGSSSRA